MNRKAQQPQLKDWAHLWNQQENELTYEIMVTRRSYLIVLSGKVPWYARQSCNVNFTCWRNGTRRKLPRLQIPPSVTMAYKELNNARNSTGSSSSLTTCFMCTQKCIVRKLITNCTKMDKTGSLKWEREQIKRKENNTCTKETEIIHTSTNMNTWSCHILHKNNGLSIKTSHLQQWGDSWWMLCQWRKGRAFEGWSI